MSSIPVIPIACTEPKYFNKFIHAAIQFDQKLLPVERENYLSKYNNNSYFFSLMRATSLKAARCSSLRRFQQIHSLDSWPPKYRAHSAFSHYSPPTHVLLDEFDNAQLDDNNDFCAPSASLTDIQVLAGEISTSEGDRYFPLVAIYPGRKTFINRSRLCQFFKDITSYDTAVTKLDPKHAIGQHKTQTPVADWMTSRPNRSIYVMHPLNTALSDYYSQYVPLHSSDGQSMETFNRVGYYKFYEQPVIEEMVRQRS